ncbi:MAG: ABC transporter substrate-binding protein [Candidatus Sungbacteria bacterium]|nr:ABC transporter substrate-binding protein [bacterium]MDZ4260472.1 ABC transporter substrate-binding protein [Candidatus Sungbacteria bacterium]
MSQRNYLRIFFCSVIMTGILSMGVLYHSAIAVQPVNHLKESIDSLQKILQNESLAREEIKAHINEKIDRLFDFREMARLVLGKYWDLNPSKQDEFVLAFSGFLNRLYFSHVDKLKNAHVKIISESTGIRKSQVKIELQAQTTYELDVSMHMVEGHWVIYDINFEGISLIHVFRAQFARRLKQGSIDDLIKEIREKKNT